MAGGVKLQDAATTGTGNTWNFRGLGGLYEFTVEPSGTISGGEVTFQAALSTSGPWATIAAAVTPATGTLSSVQVQGNYHVVRANITSNITGGGNVTCRVSPPRTEPV